MKRFLPFLLALLMLLSCLTACKDQPAPEDQTTPGESETKAPEDEQAENLVLAKNGASDYVIVRPADLTAEHPEFKAAVLFRDALEKITGATLQIVTDNEVDYQATDKEILIGHARGATYEQHAIYVSEGKLYIGGESQLLSDMVASFFSSCFDIDIYAPEVTQMNEIIVSPTLTMDQAGNVTTPNVQNDTTAWGDSITYADEVANLVNFRYLDQKRDTAEITNGDVRLVYNLDQKDNKQVSGLYNQNGIPYLTNTMDAFVITEQGDKLYSSRSGNSARGNIYRFGYYYYDRRSSSGVMRKYYSI